MRMAWDSDWRLLRTSDRGSGDERRGDKQHKQFQQLLLLEVADGGEAFYWLLHAGKVKKDDGATTTTSDDDERVVVIVIADNSNGCNCSRSELIISGNSKGQCRPNVGFLETGVNLSS